MQAESSDLPVIRLKDAKLHQLGQVPMVDYLALTHRTMLVTVSAYLAGSGADSYAIGGSVFFGLCAIIGAIDRLKD
jgi:hypothetical protein